MRAVVIREFGGPEQLRIAEVPDPVPGPDQAAAQAHRIVESGHAGGKIVLDISAGA